MPHGAWQAIVRRKGHRSQIQTFDAEQDAKQWARLIESEIDRSVFVDRGPGERVTIQELADRYARDVLPKKKSSGSIQRALRFACRHFGTYTLAILQPKDVAAYRDSRIASGTTGATVVKELNTLSRLIDVAIMEWGNFLPADPFKLVSRPNTARGRERRLLAEEESKLVVEKILMRKLILIIALGLMTYGCDRIAYVAKKVTNGVANIYQKKLNRMPDAEGQWYVCNEKYPDAPDARMICMIQNGWMRNPQGDACARGTS